jgi:TIR domain
MQDPYEFDIALSFAGEDRLQVEELADGLREFGVRVFYDRYEQADLWGKDLYQHLQRVYRDRAKYCVIFVSQHYAQKVWTKHELRQAQARAIVEQGEYILPVRLDDTELPGLNGTVGYIDLGSNNIPAIQNLLLKKLYGDDYENEDPEELTWRGELVPFRGTEVASFWPKHVETAQAKQTYRLIKDIPRIRYGDEAGFGPDVADRLCHDCAAKRGEFHVPGCDMERCPECGGQLISCECTYDEEF